MIGGEVDEFTKYVATLGVGGVLAGIMFFFYRKDVRQYTDLWKSQTELLLTIVKENTISNTKLIGVIEALHQRLDTTIDNTKNYRR